MPWAFFAPQKATFSFLPENALFWFFGLSDAAADLPRFRISPRPKTPRFRKARIAMI
jgi:hypothetical protein